MGMGNRRSGFAVKSAYSIRVRDVSTLSALGLQWTHWRRSGGYVLVNVAGYGGIWSVAERRA